MIGLNIKEAFAAAPSHVKRIGGMESGFPNEAHIQTTAYGVQAAM